MAKEPLPSESEARLRDAAPAMLAAIKRYLTVVADVPKTLRISKQSLDICRADFRAAIVKADGGDGR